MRTRSSTAALAACAVAGLIVLAGTAPAKPPKPEPRPKPTLELLTETQQGALRKRAIKVGVRSKRGDEVRVKATLVVDGFPEDYTFRLGPESEKLRDREAKVRLRLSARQREVLAFAAQACDDATVSARGKAAGKTGRVSGPLRPKGC